MLPAQLPPPSVSVVGLPLNQLPELAAAWGMRQLTRPTLAFKASSIMRSLSVEWMDAEWPSPEKRCISFMRSIISLKSVHFHTVRTSEIFSPEKRSSGPGLVPMTIRKRVPSGISIPACAAM